METPQIKQLIAERATGIGSSDIHHLFSLTPYGCARQLWYLKRQVEPDHPFHGNDATERGRVLEPIAASEYTKKTLVEMREEPVKTHPDFPYLLCHADRSIDAPEGKVMVEIKCPSRETYFKIKNQGLPDAYNLQLQWVMFLHGAKRGLFIIFCADSWKMLNFDVELDEELAKEIFTAALEFWKQVENGPAPEKLPADDRRCGMCAYRTQCQGAALLAMAGVKEETPEELPFDVSLASLVDQVRETEEIKREAEEANELAKDALRTALGERSAVETSGARIYYRAQTRETLKKDCLKAIRGVALLAKGALQGTIATDAALKEAEALPQVIESRYMNKSASRPLRVIPQ